MNCSCKQATISIVDKINPRPGLQCPFYAGTNTPVWQNPFGCIGYQDGIADNGITVFFHIADMIQISLSQSRFKINDPLDAISYLKAQLVKHYIDARIIDHILLLDPQNR